MSVVLGLVVGALGCLPAARRPRHALVAGARQGELPAAILPTSGGILIVLAVLVIEAGRAGLGALGVGKSSDLTSIERRCFAQFVLGLLGFIDDLLGDGLRGVRRARACSSGARSRRGS